jgi:hypothetical protein
VVLGGEEEEEGPPDVRDDLSHVSPCELLMFLFGYWSLATGSHESYAGGSIPMLMARLFWIKTCQRVSSSLRSEINTKVLALQLHALCCEL